VELVVLEHEPDAGVAGFAEVLDARERTTPWRRVDVLDGGPLPQDLDLVAGLVVMGGRMSATQPAAYTWMPAELELLRQAVLAEVPVLGVCLGAQLLGSALGGEVTSRAQPRGAYVATARTGAAAGDPVLGGWPEGAAPLFVHEDEVTRLPVDAVPLLTISEPSREEVVAWRAGSAWAVQFHPEVDADQLAGWTADPGLGALLARAGVEPEALAADGRVRARVAVAHGRALVGRFLDGPVRPRLS
jgi:GMP synthase (glutamine-hydrolysing)